MALVSHLLPTMNACKALDDDGCASEVSWLQGGMLPAAPLTIVGISNDHPGYITGLRVAERSSQAFPLYIYMYILIKYWRQ